ncbi:MAG: hypothetical protein H7123_07700 [Thermoleophilia bacterium]|nr:hypothetical protein [Thermoleophilia bacterium]
MAAPFDDIATAIVNGQRKMMGDAPAVDTARKAAGLNIDAGGRIMIVGDGVAAIESLIKAYSGVSGPLAERMCFMAAQSILKANPAVAIPTFSRF